MRLIPSAIISFMLSLAASVAAFLALGFLREFLLMISGTLLSFALGLGFVNVYLNASEKKRAAVPLLKMVHPHIGAYHNDCFIERGRQTFGTDKFNSLIQTYQKHKRKPDAFAPEDRDKLYLMIKSNRTEILEVLSRIHSTLTEMTSILGWSFSPLIMRDILDCRLNITGFRNLTFDDSVDQKNGACKLFLDIDADTNGVMRGLAQILGIDYVDRSS